MYVVDFLPVQDSSGASSKSGDAITARLATPLGRRVVIVIDAGFAATGGDVVTRVRE